MAKASCTSAKTVCTPVLDVSNLPEHCVQLTKGQYSTLCELRNDPLFKKTVLVPASCPSWEKLMAGKTPRRTFTWIVYHYWLGSLKFALHSKCVEHGEQLYEQIFTIYEELCSKMDTDTFVTFPPRKRRLVFNHIGQGMFRLKLELYDSGEKKPQAVTTSRSTEECQRRVRVLSAEAMRMARGSPWPKLCRNMFDHIGSLPYSILETDGVEFSHRSIDQASVGSQSAAYRHELRRSVAYIAEQMELRGDRVDWEALYVEAIATDHYNHHNLLSTLSRNVDEFIKCRGRELLQPHM